MTLAKKDIRHLEWIYDRMKSVHNENTNFDYMITFLKIIGKLHEEYIQEHRIKPTEQLDLPSENTVMWWLCRIADPEIRRKAVGLAVQFRQNGLDYTNTKLQYVCDFCSGYDYENEFFWKAVDTWSPLLPEPDFTEYNELRK